MLHVLKSGVSEVPFELHICQENNIHLKFIFGLQGTVDIFLSIRS